MAIWCYSLWNILHISRGEMIPEGLFTCWVKKPGEWAIEANPDFHVVVLTLRLDIWKKI